MQLSISLQNLAGCPRCPDPSWIIGLCTSEDFDADPRIIPGGNRMARDEVLRARLPARTTAHPEGAA